MIRLARDRTRVPVTFTGAKRASNEAELLAQVPAGQFKFKSSIWKKAKAQLRTESNGKCAYCDASTEVVAHGDVEHFRPKSVYWWLAYCYDNYLFSCQVCNQTHKGNKFPVHGPRMGPPPLPPAASGLAPDPLDDAEVKRFLKAGQAEKALLVDPYAVEPEPLFRWIAEGTLKEVSVEPRKKSGLGRKRAEVSIAELGLNREELRRWRFRKYETLYVCRLALDEGESAQSAARQQLLRDMEEGAEYAAMARYFVREIWKLPL